MGVIEGDLRGHARLYLQLGFELLPLYGIYETDGRLSCACGTRDCSSPGKHPYGRLAPRGVHSASSDPQSVAGWIRRDDANIGIATGAVSGIIVLDVDPRHGGDETLQLREEQYGELPATWRVLTGGGGEHILFRHPGQRIACSAGALGAGLDLRGDGGFIVAPPSRHISGRRYAFSVDHHPDDIRLADAPDWLVSSKSSTPIAPGKPDWPDLARNGVNEGGRNIALTRIAGHLLRRRVDPHLALEALLGFNMRRCSPPLDESEVARIVASITMRETKRRRHG